MEVNDHRGKDGDGDGDGLEKVILIVTENALRRDMFYFYF